MAPAWILAAYAAGIALSAWLPPDGPAPWCAGAGCVLLWLLLCRSPWAAVPLAGALALSGWLWAHQAIEPPRRSDHVHHRAGAEAVALAGVVQQAEQLWDGSTRLDVAIEQVGAGSTAQAATGLVRLTVRQGGAGVWPGERIGWRGRLRRPLLFGTPGEFDYPRYLAARGIYVTAFLQRGTDLVRLAAPVAADRLCERLRTAIAARIARTVPDACSGLLQTLIVGVGGGIDPQHRRLLADGGLAHLFSISGLHFGMLALLSYALAGRLYRRSERLLLFAPPRRLLPLLLLVPLYGYLLLSGNAAPTQRSFGMITLAALLFSSHRRTSPLALLATVAFGMLILSPLTLFEPSFQLSFAGVAGLMIWLPAWQPRFDGKAPWLRGCGLMVLTTVAATLSTMPLVLWHFHQIAPAGLFTNLAAVPVITWGAVPAGLAGVLLIPVASWLADLCFAGAGQLVMLTVAMTEWWLRLPGLQAAAVYVTWSGGLAALLLTAALLPGLARRRRLVLVGAAALLLVVPLAETPRLQVVALSVGQGDATLISLAGRHYLVDGGGLTGSSVDIGERLVAPALGRLGASHLDGVILTHDHPDHSAGLPFVLEHLRVDGFWSALPPERLPPDLAAALERRRIPAYCLKEGWTVLDGGEAVPLRLFVPPQDADDVNDRSIVVHATAGGEGVLLTGDLAIQGFRSLCSAGLPEPVTMLKLPHHGSRGSRPEQFLDRLHPRLAFASAGRDNPYGLPHPASVAACEKRGIPLYRTDRHGTLTFTSSGQTWQVQCFGGVGR